MFRVLFLMIALLAGLIAGPYLSGQQGYVRVETANTIYEMSLTTLVIFFVVALAIIYTLEWIVTRFFRLSSNTYKWFYRRKRVKAQRQTLEGLMKMNEGDYAKAEKYLDYFSEHDPMKSYYQGRLLQEQGKIKEAYEKYENVIFSGFSTLNFVLSTMAGLALRENDIGYARFLSGKVQAVAHTLEMGKYNEYSPMLDIVCAGKDVEGTYKVVKHLLDNVGTMYDFRKSGLYKHMKFRDIDEAILDGVKEKLLEGFRNEEEFGYMAGYEPWEKLIFDR